MFVQVSQQLGGRASGVGAVLEEEGHRPVECPVHRALRLLQRDHHKLVSSVTSLHSGGTAVLQTFLLKIW